MVLGEAGLVAQTHGAEGRCDGALARRKDGADKQYLRLHPGPVSELS